MKNILAITLFLFITLNANAQDVIVKKDGSTILAKVLEVNPADIKYKKFSNQNGPIYTINKSEIMSINYENGEKDDFADYKPNNTTVPDESPQLIKSAIGENNSDLIKMYNQDNHYKREKSTSKAHWSIDIVHVSEKSVLNNTDIELSFVPPSYLLGSFRIKITNVTNSAIYIDLGNSFRIYGDGTYETYYDNTITQTTSGSGKGVGLNLGSVAGVLGFGGAIGTLASGINVGRSSQESTTEIKYQERIISIPPHASYTLDDDEIFWKVGGGRFLCKGEEIEYNEENSPCKKDYIFTYSKDLRFASYGTIKATLFLAKQIGSKYISRDGKKDITNLNQNTLWHCSYVSK